MYLPSVPMARDQIVIPGNPGIVLTRIAYPQGRDPEALRRVLSSVTDAERATIVRELQALPRHWSSGEPVREPASPELLDNLAFRARRLFETNPDQLGRVTAT